jgi:hypothetical protein
MRLTTFYLVELSKTLIKERPNLVSINLLIGSMDSVGIIPENYIIYFEKPLHTVYYIRMMEQIDGKSTVDTHRNAGCLLKNIRNILYSFLVLSPTEY